MRSHLGEVRSELEELKDYGGFRCYSGSFDPRVEEFTMTDEEKEDLREAGEDPDALLAKWNRIRIEENAKRERWKVLSKTEAELQFLLDFLSKKQSPAG